MAQRFSGSSPGEGAEAIHEAAQASKPLNVCYALLYTVPVFLWCGDLGGAGEGLEKLMAHPNWQALPSLRATGLAMKGELALRSGDRARGTALLSEALAAMKADRQGLLVTRVACALAEGLAANEQLEEARTLISEAIAKSLDKGETLELPELLRVKATILLSMPEPHSAGAEGCLKESLDCARSQAARSWELRTALTLARVRAGERNTDQACELLASAYGGFKEGFATSDLNAARELLQTLGAA